MSYFSDNGINFGNDEFVTEVGTVPGLINKFKRNKVLRPEEIARAEQYGLSINTPTMNCRNTITYADDRYGTQTIQDMENNMHNGVSYDNPLYNYGVNDPKYRYDERRYLQQGLDGTYYNGTLKGCMRGRNKYREGRDAVPYLDKQSERGWQPALDEWGGVYKLQERFIPESFLPTQFNFKNSIAEMKTYDLLLLFLIFIIVAVLINNTMKINKIIDMTERRSMPATI